MMRGEVFGLPPIHKPQKGNKMKTFNLDQLGLYKPTLKRLHEQESSWLREDEFKERGFDVTEELLSRRTKDYTADEVRELLGVYWTSHDECVTDNCDDFSPVEVYQANQKWDRVRRIEKILEQEENLIERKEGCELRKEGDTYYMESRKTGRHTLHNPSPERLAAHWAGFVQNQTR